MADSLHKFEYVQSWYKMDGQPVPSSVEIGFDEFAVPMSYEQFGKMVDALVAEKTKLDQQRQRLEEIDKQVA